MATTQQQDPATSKENLVEMKLLDMRDMCEDVELKIKKPIGSFSPRRLLGISSNKREKRVIFLQNSTQRLMVFVDIAELQKFLSASDKKAEPIYSFSRGDASEIIDDSNETITIKFRDQNNYFPIKARFHVPEVRKTWLTALRTWAVQVTSPEKLKAIDQAPKKAPEAKKKNNQDDDFRVVSVDVAPFGIELYGITVSEVKGRAKELGIQEGDVVAECGGRKITTRKCLDEVFKEMYLPFELKLYKRGNAASLPAKTEEDLKRISEGKVDTVHEEESSKQQSEQIEDGDGKTVSSVEKDTPLSGIQAHEKTFKASEDDAMDAKHQVETTAKEDIEKLKKHKPMPEVKGSEGEKSSEKKAEKEKNVGQKKLPKNAHLDVPSRYPPAQLTVQIERVETGGTDSVAVAPGSVSEAPMYKRSNTIDTAMAVNNDEESGPPPKRGSPLSPQHSLEVQERRLPVRSATIDSRLPVRSVTMDSRFPVRSVTMDSTFAVQEEENPEDNKASPRMALFEDSTSPRLGLIVDAVAQQDEPPQATQLQVITDVSVASAHNPLSVQGVKIEPLKPREMKDYYPTNVTNDDDEEQFRVIIDGHFGVEGKALVLQPRPTPQEETTNRQDYHPPVSVEVLSANADVEGAEVVLVQSLREEEPQQKIHGAVGKMATTPATSVAMTHMDTKHRVTSDHLEETTDPFIGGKHMGGISDSDEDEEEDMDDNDQGQSAKYWRQKFFAYRSRFKKVWALNKHMSEVSHNIVQAKTAHAHQHTSGLGHGSSPGEAEINTKIQQLETNLQRSRQSFAAVQAQRDHQAAIIRALKSQHEAELSELRTSQCESPADTNRNLALLRENDQLRERVRVLSTELAQAARSENTLSSSFEAVRKQAAKDNQEVVALRRAAEECRLELEVLRKLHETDEKRIEELQRKIVAIVAEGHDKEMASNRTEEGFAALQLKLAQAKTESTDAKRVAADAKDKLWSALQEVERKKERIVQLEMLVEEASRVKNAQDKVLVATKMVQTCLRKMDELRRTNSELSSEVEKLRKARKEDRNQLTEAVLGPIQHAVEIVQRIDAKK